VYAGVFAGFARAAAAGPGSRGDRPTEIARRFEVSRVWVYQVRDRERETGFAAVFRPGAIAPDPRRVKVSVV
jgi:transposase